MEYESENKSIETSISTIVENYKDYEKEIFENVKQDSYVTIAMQMYPELKSNDLVKNQIDVYTKNNEKIKSLKLEKINCEERNNKKWRLILILNSLIISIQEM